MNENNEKETQALSVPQKMITLSEDQFRQLEEEIQKVKRPPNPLPWLALIVALTLIALVGGMGWVVYTMRPTPIVFPTQIIIPTVARTDTLIPTVTRTTTATATPDFTKTMGADPAWQAIRDYFQKIKVGDYGGAWNLLTDRCKYRECWEAWKGDFQAFKDWWWHLGVVEIRRLTPESLSEFDAQAFLILYFHKDEQAHNYRFYLKRQNELWKIERIEYVTIIK
jgi:hypothetical protein